MFGNVKKGPDLGQVETIIGQNTQFTGNIIAKGSVRIDGELEGELSVEGDVVIGEAGKVKANMKARSAVIAGIQHGNLEVAGKLEILSTGKLYGDVKVGNLSIIEGAVFKGTCAMHDDGAQKNVAVKTTKS